MNGYGTNLEGPDPTLTFNHKSPNIISRLVLFLKRHPLLFLLLLTPGIPEYLSSSSSLTLLIISPLQILGGNPPAGIILLALNLGLYGSGVILIREAMIQWKKGYPTVIVLGMAYGIVEEGLALRTLYNPLAPQVQSSNLGVYGHWIGVNWVWTAGLLIFHSVYSIALPIFLFGLAFPKLRRTSLVSEDYLSVCVVVLTFDSILLTGFANYNPGPGILILSGVTVLTLCLIGKLLPANLFRYETGRPVRSPRTYGILGVILFPATLVTGSISYSLKIPAIIPIILDFVFMFVILTSTYRSIGTEHNQEHKTMFGIGLLSPVVVFGLFASIGVQNYLVFVGDLLFILFARRLWTKWHYWTMIQRFTFQSPESSFPTL